MTRNGLYLAHLVYELYWRLRVLWILTVFYVCSVSEAPGGVLDVRPPTPQAPRHAPKPAYARIPLAEMNAVVAPLFQGPSDTPHRPAGLPRLAFKAVASHRVLFNEEEFLQGGTLAA